MLGCWYLVCLILTVVLLLFQRVGPAVRVVGYQQWDMLIVSRTCRRCALSYLLLVGLTFRLAQVRFAVDALVVAVEGPLDLSSLFA